jgi:hypothetical protein
MCNKTKAEFEDQTIGLYWLNISGDSAISSDKTYHNSLDYSRASYNAERHLQLVAKQRQAWVAAPDNRASRWLQAKVSVRVLFISICILFSSQCCKMALLVKLRRERLQQTQTFRRWCISGATLFATYFECFKGSAVMIACEQNTVCVRRILKRTSGVEGAGLAQAV